MADVESIRELAKGKRILVRSDTDSRNIYNTFGLTGSILVPFAQRHLADFVMDRRVAGARSLTPDNELAFLYDPDSYDAGKASDLMSYKQRVEEVPPIGQSSDFAVYFLKRGRNEENALFFLRSDCPAAAFLKHSLNVFLHVIPVDPTALPVCRQRYGFDNLDFGSILFWKVGDECYAVRRLPGYRIAKIRTGQSTYKGEGRWENIWEVNFSPAD